jgi:hypothetical protein
MPSKRYLDRLGVEIASESPLTLLCLLCDCRWVPATEQGKIRRGELLCLAARERGAREGATVKQWSAIAWSELGVQP